MTTLPNHDGRSSLTAHLKQMGSCVIEELDGLCYQDHCLVIQIAAMV